MAAFLLNVGFFTELKAMFAVWFLLFGFGLSHLKHGRNIRPRARCNRNFVVNGDKCVRKSIVPPLLKCGNEGILRNGLCIKITIVGANVVCPDNYVVSDNKCAKHIPVQQQCPGNFTEAVFSSKFEECFREVYIKPRKSCPAGSQENSEGFCFKQIVEVPQYTCPGVYTYDGKTCVKEEIMTPVHVCPPKYELQNNKCVNTDETKCPFGYNLVMDTCERKVTTKATLVCVEGVFDKNKQICVGKEHITPKSGCMHSDAKVIKGKCVRQIEDELVWGCPNGAQFDGKNCVKEKFSYPILKCEISETLNSRNECERIDSIKPAKCFGVGCLLVRNKKPSLQCPNGTEMGNKGCVLVARVDANITCANGQLVQNRCVGNVKVNNTMTCEHGVLVKGNRCLVREKVKPRTICDEGFILNHGGKDCVKFHQAIGNVSCPPGSFMKDGKCVIENVSVPTSECPHLYTINDGNCVKIEEEKVSYSCPPGLLSSGANCVPS